MKNPLLLTCMVSVSVLATACFSDVNPGDERSDDDSSGDGDGDGEPGDGDGETGDGDGEPGDGDGDGEPGDGDGDGDGDGEPGDGDGDGESGCEPGSCADGEYCVANICTSPPEGMVAVPAGPFWMGCNEDVDDNCGNDEYPYHQVTLSAFALDRTEVTASAYDDCVAAGECAAPQTMHDGNPCETSQGSWPVVCVSWFQAREYCSWAGKQLPSEAQWEKAARGDDGRLYPWGNGPAECNLTTWWECVADPKAQPVGSFPAGASPYGALDLAGNVIEWTADWYSSAYYVESPDTDPQGPPTGTQRVPRGGYYGSGSSNLRSSGRGGIALAFTPDIVGEGVGFRCVLNP